MQPRGGRDRRSGEEHGSTSSGETPEVLREGADELTMRREEEGLLRTVIDTTNVEDNKWVPPLVDEV